MIKCWFLEKISKIDKSLAKMTQERRVMTQIYKIRYGKGDITINNIEITMEYFQNLYCDKLENVVKMDNFVDAFDLTKPNRKYIDHFNRSTKNNQFEAVIVTQKRSQDPKDSLENYIRLLKKSKLFHEIEREGILPNSL
jgi:hypothetical protein